jgi:hypothetical protein
MGTGGMAGTTSMGGGSMGGTTSMGGGGMGVGGDSGSGDDNPAYAGAGREINVTGTNVYDSSIGGQPLYLNHSRPIQGKLMLFLGGYTGGCALGNPQSPGSGGLDGFAKMNGFHVFLPRTDTALGGGCVPEMYKDAADEPTNAEANRQLTDALLEIWDGTDRVDWYTYNGQSMRDATIAAIHQAEQEDPTGDWGYFLDAEGNLRTGDVWVAGYSWGAQTWATISAFVPFGRVITTSGPHDDGFPYGAWITDPSPLGTPGHRKYMLVGMSEPYTPMSDSNQHERDMVETVENAGWLPGVTDVSLSSAGPYADPERLFALIGSDATSPGGHTIFCTDNPANNWMPVCNFVFGLQ